MEYSVGLAAVCRLTRPMQRTAKARFFVERVLPVVLVQLGVDYAGEVHLCRWGVVYSTLSNGNGSLCSPLIGRSLVGSLIFF